MIIGICGKSGSGKSTLAEEIKKKYPEKAIHIDIDKTGHCILEIQEVKIELIRHFKENILTDNKIDRKKLSKIVFREPQEMNILSEITWRHIERLIDKIIESNLDKIIILDWILLPKTKYFNMCNLKILLDIPYEIRKKRILKRDNITEEAASLRESASPKYDKEYFDYILNNTEKTIIRKLVKII